MVASCPCICCSCRKKTPFSCRYSQNVTDCRKEIYATCLFKESMFLWKSEPPLPTRSLRSLRSTAHFNSSALCLCKRSHPFVAFPGKTRLMQRSRRCGHGVVISKMCYVQYSDCVQDLDYKILIVLSVVLSDCRKPLNNCRD